MKPGDVKWWAEDIRVLRRTDRHKKPRYRIIRYVNSTVYRSQRAAEDAINRVIAKEKRRADRKRNIQRGPESSDYPIFYRDRRIYRCEDDARGRKQYRIMNSVEEYFRSVDRAIAEIDRRYRAATIPERAWDDLPMNQNK